MKSVEEWIQGFNLMYNNLSSDKAPGLELYEMSRLLTDAEDTVVVALYNGSLGESFESTEALTTYLGTLVKQGEGKVASEAGLYHLFDGTTVFELPNDILFRTLEACTIQNSCGKEVLVPVVPVTQDEFWRTVRNPFKKQNDNRVLRLSYATGKETGGEQFAETNYAELISDNTIVDYKVRYLSRPEPIILETLSDGLSIHGKTDMATCKLPEILHQTILAEAVRQAKAIWNNQ